MMATLSAADLGTFARAVVENLGLQFEEHRLEELASVLQARIASSGCRGFADYLQRLTSSATGRDECSALAQLLTVGETYFFRHSQQIDAFAERVLPELIERRPSGSDLRILSAGCATGEEPYTIAMVLREKEESLAGQSARVLGIDINRGALEKAKAARYSEWSLRETPPRYRERFFSRVAREYQLDPSLRSTVEFAERNLAAESSELWKPSSFDVIFCRNVIMYFPPNVMRGVVRRLASSLVPGGYLFLGHAETMRGVSQEFDLVQSHEAFYYRRRKGGSIAGAESMGAATSFDPLPAPAEGEGTPQPALSELAAVSGNAWYDAIQRASARIGSLTRDAVQRDAAATCEIERRAHLSAEGAEFSGARCDLGPALRALASERFTEALALIDGLPQADPEVKLLRAVILSNRGDVDAGTRILESMAAVANLHALVRYQLGVCSEQTGDSEKAIEHYRAAIYLDASFAIPHMQLGRLAKKAGDLRTAQNEWRHALELLELEDPTRIVLFGGGFGREALHRLCRSQLRRLRELARD